MNRSLTSLLHFKDDVSTFQYLHGLRLTIFLMKLERPFVSRVYRFEDRAEEVLYVSKKLNMKFTGVFAQDVANHKSHYSNYYDQESKKTVEKLFARDFELGDYPIEI